MRVFITGGTGFVGEQVVFQLVTSGHSVLGLSRSTHSDTKLTKMGVSILKGELKDLDIIAKACKDVDGVIHCGFVHDFDNFDQAVQLDAQVISQIGNALVGTNKPFVVTSGVPVAHGAIVTEDTPWDVVQFPRRSEATALPFADKGIRLSIVRPSRFVHGDGCQTGFVGQLIEIARKTGVSAYIGDGKNRTQAVNHKDLGLLYRLALEKGSGIYHGVAEGDLDCFTLATLIGNKLSLPTKSLTLEDGLAHFGFVGRLLTLDNPASSTKTQQSLSWTCTHNSLAQDLQAM
jgi:nucleoside-diphosphate-sugar epimerase